MSSFTSETTMGQLSNMHWPFAMCKTPWLVGGTGLSEGGFLPCKKILIPLSQHALNEY